MKKVIKRIFVGLLLLIPVFMIGLTINNGINRSIYSKIVTNADTLSQDELVQVKEVYTYLAKQGEAIIPGFNGKNIDVIIFNEAYEFLISPEAIGTQWDLIEYNSSLDKNIYRRKANNPQAFTVNIDGRWVGSMSTKNHLTKSLISTLGDAGALGYLIPPQVFVTDNEHYKGLIIHEMIHAYEAIRIEDRLIKDQTISNVSGSYENNNRFQELIKLEARYIEKALKTENQKEAIKYTRKFLDTRKLRREECKLSVDEINTETQFEWLEGLARYAEYVSSADSKAIIRKNLTNIENKISEGGDEKYYALGMAQAMVLDKLNSKWKENAFKEGFTLEGTLEEAIMQ